MPSDPCKHGVYYQVFNVSGNKIAEKRRASRLARGLNDTELAKISINCFRAHAKLLNYAIEGAWPKPR